MEECFGTLRETFLQLLCNSKIPQNPNFSSVYANINPFKWRQTVKAISDICSLSSTAMIGPTLIPIVNYMGSEMIVMPLIIMGILLIFGGLARFEHMFEISFYCSFSVSASFCRKRRINLSLKRFTIATRFRSWIHSAFSRADDDVERRRRQKTLRYVMYANWKWETQINVIVFRDATCAASVCLVLCLLLGIERALERSPGHETDHCSRGAN